MLCVQDNATLCYLIFCENPEERSEARPLLGATFGTPCGTNKVSYENIVL